MLPLPSVRGDSPVRDHHTAEHSEGDFSGFMRTAMRYTCIITQETIRIDASHCVALSLRYLLQQTRMQLQHSLVRTVTSALPLPPRCALTVTPAVSSAHARMLEHAVSTPSTPMCMCARGEVTPSLPRPPPLLFHSCCHIACGRALLVISPSRRCEYGVDSSQGMCADEQCTNYRHPRCDTPPSAAPPSQRLSAFASLGDFRNSRRRAHQQDHHLTIPIIG